MTSHGSRLRNRVFSLLASLRKFSWFVVATALGACTTAIDLPRGFWDEIHAEDFNRQIAQKGVRDLIVRSAQFEQKCVLETKARYDAAGRTWNALYDTLSVIVNSERHIADWSGYLKARDEASARTTEFFTAYDQTTNYGSIKNGTETIPCKKPDGAKATAPESFFASPLLSFSPLSISDLAKMAGDLNRKERTVIANALSQMKWLSIGCIEMPTEADCKPPAPEKNI